MPSTDPEPDHDRAWVAAGIGEVAREALSRGLPAHRLWSLLLDVLAQRAGQRTPADVLRQYERDGFTRPSYVDQRTLVALDAHLLAAAEAFEAIELSPLAPLGTCSAVGLASQNKIVSALRGTEVVSDPTNVMALESAQRLRADPAAVVRLATSHRCVRAQALPKQKGFARHFRIFCMTTAGREQKDHAFAAAALIEHVAVHLAALDRLEQHGYAFPARSVKVLAAPGREALGDRVAAGIVGAKVTREPLNHAYYDGLRFMISTETVEGAAVPLIDGGTFDWLEKLTSNRRMVLVASGMGAQLAPYLFRR